MTFEISGDGSQGIKGNLEIETKEKAITIIAGLMDSFKINGYD